MERLLDGARDVLGFGDQEIVFGDRLGDARRVALLEGVGADRRVGNLAGDDHHGNRVEVRVTQRGDDVGGRRPAGHHGHAGSARGLGVALGHVAGALLVADQDVANRRVDDRVVDRQDRSAGQPEHDLNALLLEGADQRSTAVHLFCGHGTHDLLGDRVKSETTSLIGRSRHATVGRRGACLRQYRYLGGRGGRERPHGPQLCADSPSDHNLPG